MIKNFLNSKGHQNPFSGSKVTAILLKGWVWPIGGVASGRVCACSLRSRLVYGLLSPKLLLNYGPGSANICALDVAMVCLVHLV